MNQAEQETELRKRFFSSQHNLRSFLLDRYFKYYNMPIRLKPNLFRKHKGSRIGFYQHHTLPVFMNDQRIHYINFGDKINVLCESEFEIYKKKIKDEDGNFVHFVDVKCPDCSHIDVYNMRYLVWKMNCKKCRHTVTVNDRVKKEKFNMSDFR